MYVRTEDRDIPTNWECRLAQYDAVCEWGMPNHGLLERVERHRGTGLRRQRRQRSDDPPSLLVLARWGCCRMPS